MIPFRVLISKNFFVIIVRLEFEKNYLSMLLIYAFLFIIKLSICLKLMVLKL